MELELDLVREFSKAVVTEIAAVRGVRTQADDVQTKLQLDRNLCRLYEREAEITSRLGDVHDGDILAELDRVHYLMFVLETLVWLQVVEIDAQSPRSPIEYIVPQNAGPLQVQRVEFLVGQLASTAAAAAAAEWPFAGSSADRLTQQSVICYLLPSRYATQYASYCSIPAAFQQYMNAFREIDELTSVQDAHAEVSLAEVSRRRHTSNSSDDSESVTVCARYGRWM